MICLLHQQEIFDLSLLSPSCHILPFPFVYGVVDLVLDFFVKKQEQGGYVYWMEQLIPTHGFEWQQNGDLSIHYKKSEFQLFERKLADIGKFL